MAVCLVLQIIVVSVSHFAKYSSILFRRLQFCLVLQMTVFSPFANYSLVSFCKVKYFSSTNVDKFSFRKFIKILYEMILLLSRISLLVIEIPSASQFFIKAFFFSRRRTINFSETCSNNSSSEKVQR